MVSKRLTTIFLGGYFPVSKVVFEEWMQASIKLVIKTISYICSPKVLVLRSYWSIKDFYLGKSRPSYYFEDRSRSLWIFVGCWRLLLVIADRSSFWFVRKEWPFWYKEILRYCSRAKWNLRHIVITLTLLNVVYPSQLTAQFGGGIKNKKCKVISNIFFYVFQVFIDYIR